MKIAVVDDERPARKELISQILDVKPDCIVKEADSGGSALELFNKEDDFDMLFIDINLNDMEGTTLAATVKKLLPQARLCLLLLFPLCSQAFEMEIDDYILKPFDPDRVRHVIEKCMKDPEQSKEQAEAVRGIAVGASVRIPVQVKSQHPFFRYISDHIWGNDRGGGHCFIQKQELRGKSVAR